MHVLSAPACRGLHRKYLPSLAGSIGLAALLGAAAGTSARAADPLPLTNAPAPNLALASLDHGATDLAGRRGRVVLVHFFATWCEPCRDEMAALRRLAARMKDRPFLILAVDVGEVEIRVRRFFDADPVPFPVLLDADRAAMKAWQVGAFPTSYLLDPSLNIRLSAAAPVAWDDPRADDAINRLSAGAALDDAAALPLDDTPRE